MTAPTAAELRAAQAEAGRARRLPDRRPGREGVQAKAHRYLREARLQVLEVGPGIVQATCRGDTGTVHRLGWWRGRWGCSCPAAGFGRSCAHLAALHLVVPGPPAQEAGGSRRPGRWARAGPATARGGDRPT
jgi:hypothetical protein